MIWSNDSIQSYSYDSNPVITVFARVTLPVMSIHLQVSPSRQCQLMHHPTLHTLNDPMGLNRYERTG